MGRRMQSDADVGRNGHAAAPGPGQESDDFTTVSLAQLKNSRVRFLWRDRLALGAVSILEGRKGEGKSTLAAALAAQVTGGPKLPGERGRGTGKVLWFAGEENITATTRPKLLAAGASKQGVLFPGCDAEGILTHKLFFPGDSERLREVAKENGAWLIVFDPLSSFVAPGMDLNNGQQARAVMEALTQAAVASGAAIIVIRHLIKSSRGDALCQGMGSAEIGNVARTILRCDRHPDEQGECILSVVATNLGERAPALRYRLEDCKGAPRVRWLGKSDLDADQLAEGVGDLDDRSAVSDAQAFLCSALKKEKQKATDMYTQGKALGLSPKQLRTARKKLGVVLFEAKDGGSKCWWWTLPT